MGNHISLKPSNKTMVDRLVERSCYISSQKVEGVFRAVDRAMYFDIEEGEPTDPYEDDPWRRGNLHLSAPCIYAKVVEALDLRDGLSFLNLGSGTGYLNTIVGLLIGPNGVNHGVEFYADVVEYAYDRLQKFKQKSHAIDKYDFAEPIFMKGNCLNLNTKLEYDRIYLGAACLPSMELFVKKLIKPGGGILVMPFENHLIRHTRITANEWKSEKLMDVNFTLMIGRNEDDTEMIDMPLAQVKSLRELCRITIRQQLRTKTDSVYPNLLHSDNIEYRRQRARAHHAALHSKEKLERLRRTNSRRRTERDSDNGDDDDDAHGRYSCCCRRNSEQNRTHRNRSSNVSLGTMGRVVTRSASRCLKTPGVMQQKSSNVRSLIGIGSSNEAGECSSSGYLADTSRRQTRSTVIDDDNLLSSDSGGGANKVDCARTRPYNDLHRSNPMTWGARGTSSRRDSDSLSSSSSLHSTDNSIYDLTDELEGAYESEHWCAFPLSSYSNPHSPPLFWDNPDSESSSIESEDEDDDGGRIYAVRFPNDFTEDDEDEEHDANEDVDDEDEENDLDEEVVDEQLSSSSSGMSLISSPSEVVEVSAISADDDSNLYPDNNNDDNIIPEPSNSSEESKSNKNSLSSCQEQPVASRLRSRRLSQADPRGASSSLVSFSQEQSQDQASCSERNRLSNSAGKQFSRSCFWSNGSSDRQCCEQCRSCCRRRRHPRFCAHGCVRCQYRSERDEKIDVANRSGLLDYSPTSIIVSNATSSSSVNTSQADQLFSNRLLIATGLGATSFSISQARSTNDRLNSSSSASPPPPPSSSSSSRLTFRPIARRSVLPQSGTVHRRAHTLGGHGGGGSSSSQQFRTPIGQRLARIATIQSQSLQQPISSLSVHKRKRPHSSSSESSDAPTSHSERQSSRNPSSRMRTRLSSCTCERAHCSTTNNLPTSGVSDVNLTKSADNVSKSALLHRHQQSSGDARSGGQNYSDNINGGLLNQPRQSSSSFATSPNMSATDQLGRPRERVNSGSSSGSSSNHNRSIKLQQGNTSMVMPFDDGEHFRRNEKRQLRSLDQNNDIIPPTMRTTRSSLCRGSTSAASLVLPSASTTLECNDDRGLFSAHKGQLQTNSEEPATTGAFGEQSMARPTMRTSPTSSCQQEHCSTTEQCRSCFIKKASCGSGRLSNNCDHTNHQQRRRRHNHHHQHNHKCRHRHNHGHSHSHSHHHHHHHRRRRHHHHCRHRHEHHRCHHQPQPQQPKQLPANHRGIYLYRNHRQSQQQRASKRLGDLVKSGSAWRRIEALRSRVEAARAGALQERRRRLKRERRSKRKRQNECEKYHNHMCSYIRRLPLPRVLLTYLNYDRIL